MFKKCMMLYSKKDYSQAEILLQEFNKKYPNSVFNKRCLELIKEIGNIKK